MVEKAFTLSHSCELYQQFFESANEKQRSHELARAFFQKNDLMGKDGQYILSERLMISLDDERYERFKSQLMKDTLDGLYKFKKGSTINKAWQQEVVEHVDMKKMDRTRFWYFPYINGKGSQALWTDGEDVYGYLKSYDGEPALPDGATEIKLSQYYAKIEEIEERNKACS